MITLASLRQSISRWFFTGSMSFILLVALVLRLYRIDAPLADWHSFRQADTASVTREFVKNGIDVLRPQYHDLSNIQSGEENPDGWRMVEFPLVNAFVAQLLHWQPNWDLVLTSRVVTILATVTALGLFIDVLRRYTRPGVALGAGLVWAVMPYAIYYGRVILPEPFVLLFVILTAWFLDHWLRSKHWWWLVATAFAAAAALLVKPVAIFFAPWWLGMVVSYRPRDLRWHHWLQMILVASVAFIPLIAWRIWIQQFPTGIPAADWLLNGNGIRLRPAWWRWLFADRIGRLMFGYWGASFMAFGVVTTLPSLMEFPAKQAWWRCVWQWLVGWVLKSGALLGLSLGLFAYLVVFASGNVQHDYYQALLIPLVSWLTAEGVLWLLDRSHAGVERVAMGMAVLFVGVLSWVFAWYHVKDWFTIQNPAIVAAGEAVDQLTPEDALVIAPYMGDTAFLFQTNRRGWPIGFNIDQRLEQGADYYVSTSYDDEANELMQAHEVVVQEKDFVLIQLKEQ